MYFTTRFNITLTSRYPPVTFDTILSRVPSLPSFREGINFGSTALRRGSVAFARFSNERVSTINIGQRAAASGEESSIERTEPVDAETKPIETPVPDRTEVGFTNLTYDLIGVGGGSGHADDTSVKETAAAKDAQTKLGTTKETAAPKQETEHVYDLVDVRFQLFCSSLYRQSAEMYFFTHFNR